MPTATILPFKPRPCPRAGFSLRDRILLAEWEERARWFGLEKVVADLDAELGGFVLIYAEERSWASYGIGIEGGRFIVWRPGTGVTFAMPATLADALAAVIADRGQAGHVPSTVGATGIRNQL